jgi:hypothetical protein
MYSYTATEAKASPMETNMTPEQLTLTDTEILAEMELIFDLFTTEDGYTPAISYDDVF